MTGKIYVVVGGQYGSEGKGAVAGRICADLGAMGRVLNVRVGGPNAGHTVIGRCPPGCGDAHEVDKHPWRLRQVPVAAVTAPGSTLVIAAGSEIDPTVLADEMAQLDGAGYLASSRLMIDRSATMITPAHIAQEVGGMLGHRIGSTAKGIGAARADRVWRCAQLYGDWARFQNLQLTSYDTADYLRMALSADARVVIEGTQGYGLGLHTSRYPKVTSGDCRAIDFLAQAGVSPWQAGPSGLAVVIAIRPHPIRVAGNSGPLAGETSWEELGLPVEKTTVTQKVRRVGSWDPQLVREALYANGGPRQGVVWAALTMMDSVHPALAGADYPHSGDWDSWTGKAVGHYLDDMGLSLDDLGYVGTGPDTAIVNKEMYR